MADPTPYARGFSFTDYQESTPQDPLPGPNVDVELDEIAGVVSELIDAVKDVRRSDGALKNGIVTVDSLASTFAAGVRALAEAEAGSQAAAVHADSVAAASSAGAAAGSASAAAASAASLTAATQAEAEAGTNNTKIMTPLRVRQAVKVYLEHPPSIKGLGFDVRGDGSSSDADMTRETAAINAAFQASRAVTFPPGNYLINGPTATQHDAHIIAPWGFEATTITRGGSQNWAGHTLRLGPDQSYSAYVDGLKFSNPHPTFNTATPGSTITNRLTQGQAHLFVRGGAQGVIKNCRFENAVYNLLVEGGTNWIIENNAFNGTWDDVVTGRCETTANIYIRNDLSDGGPGYATMHSLIDNYLAGAMSGGSENRTYIVGNVSWSSHHDVGPAYGVLVEGCEGLKIRGGYIGANNRNSVRFSVGATLLGDVDIEGVFFDAQQESAIGADNISGGGSVSGLTVHGCTLNGQLSGPRAVSIGNTNGVSVDDMLFFGNVLKNHTQAPILLNGLRNSIIMNNIIRNYNARVSTSGVPGDCAGVVLSGSSFDVTIGGNTWSGPGSKWGPYFVSTAHGTATPQRGTMGLAGGSLVGGVTPSAF